MSSPTECATWRVGNLVHTRKGLFTLFFWLLWFDFSWTVLESVAIPMRPSPPSATDSTPAPTA